MELDSTFWVAVSFLLFIILLVYFKIPQKVNELLSKMIEDIGKEIDESEKLRSESRSMLDKSQSKLSTAKCWMYSSTTLAYQQLSSWGIASPIVRGGLCS